MEVRLLEEMRTSVLVVFVGTRGGSEVHSAILGGSLPGPAPAVPLPLVIPADLLLINACISQSPGSKIQKYRKSKIQSSLNPEQQSDPTNAAITRFTIQSTMRASVQHTGLPTVAGMYKNCTKEESPEIGI